MHAMHFRCGLRVEPIRQFSRCESGWLCLRGHLLGDEVAVGCIHGGEPVRAPDGACPLHDRPAADFQCQAMYLRFLHGLISSTAFAASCCTLHPWPTTERTSTMLMPYASHT